MNKNTISQSIETEIILGPVFSLICHEYPEYVDKLVAVCDVFARMSPDQKQLLVNRLQEIDLTVAMCGDGANDCSALKVFFDYIINLFDYIS